MPVLMCEHVCKTMWKMVNFMATCGHVEIFVFVEFRLRDTRDEACRYVGLEPKTSHGAGKNKAK